MPAQNRVTPFGDIVASPGRGLFMGNRGVLHDASGERRIVRTHQVKAWITCVLSFKDQRLPQWAPGHYSQLFFLDEAVALSAGHRPCAYCRRADYNDFRAAYVRAHGGDVPLAPQLDAALHAQRLSHELTAMDWALLPDGVFVVVDDLPAVVVGDHLSVFDTATTTYVRRLPRPRAGRAAVLTPAITAASIAAGYAVQVHPSARHPAATNSSSIAFRSPSARCCR